MIIFIVLNIILSYLKNENYYFYFNKLLLLFQNKKKI